MKAFALTHEGDLVGVAPMDPLYIYEGYELTHPWVVVIGVSMEHGELDHLPPSLENTSNPVEVARQYNRAARACRELNNFILSQGYEAKAWQGPFASALNMMPAAIQAGLGTLGKHGSLINEEFGSSFRLSAVTTEMPLADTPKDIGAEDFVQTARSVSKPARRAPFFQRNKWFGGQKNGLSISTNAFLISAKH